MTTIGYGRPSGSETDPEEQRLTLEYLGAEELFVDAARLGRTRARPGLDACLARLQSGDTLLVTGLVRLSRSIEHVVDLMSELYERDIALRSVAENLDTNRPINPGAFAAMLADVNAGIIRENTLAGLARAELAGRRPGRPPIMTQTQIEQAALLRREGQSWRNVGQSVGVPHATVRRTLNALEVALDEAESRKSGVFLAADSAPSK